jgi:hypothetical protein
VCSSDLRARADTLPLCLDRRSGADRNECEKVTALAREIVMENPNAFVISDGVKGVECVTTFQSMKGLNGLEDRDVYVVLTSLAPEKYAQLNVIGQWLGQGNVIQEFYQDQINQAVGRNQGFLKSTNKQTDKDDGSRFAKIMEQRVGKNAKRSAEGPVVFGGRATLLLISNPDIGRNR